MVICSLNSLERNTDPGVEIEMLELNVPSTITLDMNASYSERYGPTHIWDFIRIN